MAKTATAAPKAAAKVSEIRGFEPIAGRILVERESSVAVSPGGIVLPDRAQERPTRGQIVKLGPGELNDKGERKPFQVKVGDKVIFNAYAGHPVTLDGREDFLLLTEADILAVIE